MARGGSSLRAGWGQNCCSYIGHRENRTRAVGEFCSQKVEKFAPEWKILEDFAPRWGDFAGSFMCPCFSPPAMPVPYSHSSELSKPFTPHAEIRETSAGLRYTTPTAAAVSCV